MCAAARRIDVYKRQGKRCLKQKKEDWDTYAKAVESVIGGAAYAGI